MQSNKGRDTKPELRLRSAVHALGMRYRVDFKPVASVRRRADLVFTRAHIAVFVDGCFWHGCPEHFTVSKTNAEFWAKKHQENWNRDRETDRLLQEAGWTVFRFWEHEPIEAAALAIQEAWKRANDCSTRTNRNAGRARVSRGQSVNEHSMGEPGKSPTALHA